MCGLATSACLRVSPCASHRAHLGALHARRPTEAPTIGSTRSRPESGRQAVRALPTTRRTADLCSHGSGGPLAAPQGHGGALATRTRQVVSVRRQMASASGHGCEARIVSRSSTESGAAPRRAHGFLAAPRCERAVLARDSTPVAHLRSRSPQAHPSLSRRLARQSGRVRAARRTACRLAPGRRRRHLGRARLPSARRPHADTDRRRGHRLGHRHHAPGPRCRRCGRTRARSPATASTTTATASWTTCTAGTSWAARTAATSRWRHWRLRASSRPATPARRCPEPTATPSRPSSKRSAR